MAHWILKSEPNTYSFDDLIRLKRDHWDGVRNYQARNNLKAMKKGDTALIYHSVSDKTLVGVAEVVSDHYPDPTDDTGKWVVVDVVPKHRLKKHVSLAEIKDEKRLQDIALVKQSRLSVIPITDAEYQVLMEMAEGTQPL